MKAAHTDCTYTKARQGSCRLHCLLCDCQRKIAHDERAVCFSFALQKMSLFAPHTALINGTPSMYTCACKRKLSLGWYTAIVQCCTCANRANRANPTFVPHVGDRDCETVQREREQGVTGCCAVHEREEVDPHVNAHDLSNPISAG